MWKARVRSCWGCCQARRSCRSAWLRWHCRRSSCLKDFRYHRQFASDDGLNVVLEFSARVGDKRLKGIDIIRFDEQGLITEFEVMIRPLNGLQALGAEMGARLGQQLPGFKTRA